ncbi:MAG: translation initiation factor IF-2 [Rhodospirillaceae bacterium]|nr:translation initiation factor IF-2 [Rhodospirillaceae bacterium]
MMDTNEQDQKRQLKLARPGRLELAKGTKTSQVRQSFPHGRSKIVTVEVKRKRAVAPAVGKPADTKIPAAETPPPERALEVAVASVQTEETRRAAVLRTLTDEERAARARALKGARLQDLETRCVDVVQLRRLEEEELRRAEEQARRKVEEEARRKTEEEARRKAEEESRRKAEEETRKLAEAEAEKRRIKGESAGGKPQAATAEEEELEHNRRRTTALTRRPPVAAPRRPDAKRRSGKITVVQALDEDRGERTRSVAAFRRAREKERLRQLKAESTPLKIVRDVVVPEAITVQDLANRMAERGVDVIKALMKMGVMATINQVIDADTAELVVTEFGHRLRRVTEADVEIGLKGIADEGEVLKPRAPVVTVMGHVDHGKTSLLDALRTTDVAKHEAGGITQHIGAYRVELRSGRHITFLDTPGHEAFTAMRARGAKATDIVVLVVAADDGIQPQTIEAINHAKAANVPIIVAINKIDKSDANADRVRRDLLQHSIATEEMGGDTLAVEVSATKGTNLEKLEEAILLQAELLDLKANPSRPAEGVVIESKLERGRGSVATVLIQRGTLRTGDVFVAGSEWGRVRAIYDDKGRKLDDAGPSMPVEVLGLNGTPSAGDDFNVVDGESRAREVTLFRQRRSREARVAIGSRGTLEQMFSKIAAGEAKELAVVVKTDVQGSIDAIRGALEKLTNSEVAVRVIHSGVGGINEGDLALAKASNALIVGFNVRANPQAREFARRDGVEIRYYSIIYNIVDDVKAALSGMLTPTIQEKALGLAEIREVFSISKIGKVAGCRVTEGVVKRGAKVRLLRGDVVIHEGSLRTLRRFKDEVRDVQSGYECGMAFENYHDIQVGDVIECFEMEEVSRTL